MKILITGGMGYVGSHLIDLLLKDKHKIVLLTKSYSKKKNISQVKSKIKVEKIDVTNQRKLSNSIEQHKPDIIIHLAGITSHSKSFDVISGIKTIINKGKAGNLYWISSSKKTWFYELGSLLEKLTGTKVKFVKTPNYTKKVDVGNFVVNNSKLKSLGWKPKVNLNQGIRKTLEYFESEKIS